MSESRTKGSGLPGIPPRRAIGRRLRSISGILISFAGTLFGLLVLTFFLARVLPIDPVEGIVGPGATREAYDAVYAELGFDKPLPEQFVVYVRDILSGNFGTALLTGNDVIADIKRTFPATLELATFAILLGILVGIPLGALAAVRQGEWPDHVARIVTLLGYSAPIFWLGLMALIIFYATLGWTGGPGRMSVWFEGSFESHSGILLIDAALAGRWDIFMDSLRHIILPASLLAFASLAYIARMTRSLMIGELRQEYVTAARLKGLSSRRIVFRHVLPAIAVPLLTVIILSYAALLDGAVLIETVFSWPGFGQYLTSALLFGDMNAVLGGTLLVGVIYLSLNLLSDILYRVLDPRLRS